MKKILNSWIFWLISWVFSSIIFIGGFFLYSIVFVIGYMFTDGSMDGCYIPLFPPAEVSIIIYTIIFFVFAFVIFSFIKFIILVVKS
ncbi:MAG: hypothetical protein CVV02_18105 [Firmicutes bacterium HGW-Firmicutes-7]|nr:MAG: hypothetical protein CVV02_18105 [Firmicutes bacterium HGW-Firmicutes-7]